MNITSYTTLVVASTALVTSGIALYKLVIERKNYLVDSHDKFQSRFREIQKRFPTEVNSTDKNGVRIWEPDHTDKDAFRNIEHYWYFVFDEWYFCNVGDKRLEKLWLDLYQHGVASALKIKGFRKCFELMMESDSSFFNRKDPFCKEIQRIHKEINNVNHWKFGS